MLSRDEQALVQRDTGLPGLALLLDEAAFLEAMRTQLPAAGLQQACKEYIRYKPGMNLLVRYLLQGTDGSLHVYAKAHGPDAAVKLGKAGMRPVVTSALGAGRLVLPDHGVVVCTFPNDDKLKSLRLLGHGERRIRLLQELLPDHPGFHRADIEVLQYKPERRFVACLHAADGARAVFKLYGRGAFAHALSSARQFATGQAAVFPRLIGTSEHHRLLISEWHEGRRLSDVYGEPEYDVAVIRRLGQQLAAFHQGGAGSGLAVRLAASEATVLQALAEGAAAIAPALADGARSLARSLGRQLVAMRPLQRQIHGDFYAGQVLCTDYGMQLLDSDEACCGHPAADVGLFLAHLEREVLCGRVSRSRATAIEEAFLQGYATGADRTFCAAVDLYTAVGLMQLLHHPFRNCEADWPQRMQTLLEAAAQRLLCYERSTAAVPGRADQCACRVMVVDPHDAASDRSMPFLAAALDPHRAGAKIGACLSEHEGSTATPELASISVRRHKAGRRCLIEYRFHAARPALQEHPVSVIGKLRARGLDRRTWRLNCTLYAKGFASGCEDGIEIPEPMGTVPAFHMWLQRQVAGEAAYPLLGSNDARTMARRVAEAIHKLHRTQLPTDRTHGMEDELGILGNALVKVAMERPQWRARLKRLFEACRRLAASVAPVIPVGIHRDFYHDQLLVNGRQVFLLDLDLYCLGDPALDIGNFVAHLQEQSLRETGNLNALDDTAGVLIEHYQRLEGREMRASIEAYRLLSLVRHITISRRIPERHPFTDKLLEICEEQLMALGFYRHAMTGT